MISKGTSPLSLLFNTCHHWMRLIKCWNLYTARKSLRPSICSRVQLSRTHKNANGNDKPIRKSTSLSKGTLAEYSQIHCFTSRFVKATSYWSMNWGTQSAAAAPPATDIYWRLAIASVFGSVNLCWRNNWNWTRRDHRIPLHLYRYEIINARKLLANNNSFN